MIRKICLASTALAVAIAFSPVQAASLIGPSSQPAAETLVQSVKMKRKGKMEHKGKRHRMGHRKGKRAGSKGPGRCGTNMYHKKGKCMDARNK
jgi:uncharacterized low-complexity protein